MKRFISKIDHDLHILLNTDMEKAKEYWDKIKNRGHILDQAREMIKDKRGNKCVYAPSICHMILSNPCDVDKDFYNNFALTVIRDKYLSRLVVAENLSYTSLILLRGSNDLNILASKALMQEISAKKSYNPYQVRNVLYDEIISQDDKVQSRFKFDKIEVKLTGDEVDTYLKNEHISIYEDINIDEVDELMRYAMIDGNMDINFKKVIFDLYQNSLEFKRNNNIDYGTRERTPKL